MGKNSPGNTGYTETGLFHGTPQRVMGPQQSLRASLRMASLRIQGWNPHHSWINTYKRPVHSTACLDLFVSMHQEWETLPEPNLLLGWEHWNTLTCSGVGKTALLGTLASKQDNTLCPLLQQALALPRWWGVTEHTFPLHALPTRSSHRQISPIPVLSLKKQYILIISIIL